MSPSLFSQLSVLAVLATQAMGYEHYFSIGHPQFLRTRLDPVLSPGTVSTHVHSIVGSSAFAATESYAVATGGECTTSFIQADKSSYWTEELYYRYKNGSFIALKGDGLVTYWKYSVASDTETFAVVPDEFRMVAGNISRDYFDPKLAAHQAISFECIGDGFDKRLPWIPSDIECKTIRPQVFFPNCWNGVDAYLPGSAHVSYPTNSNNYESGECPKTHPHRIPSLFMESYYHPTEVPGYEWYPGCLVLATGDKHGLSHHADWLDGWPSGMLVNARNQCADKLQGTVDGCSVFEASRDQAKANSCYAKGQLVAEPVGYDTPLQYLPGNNMVYNSSRDAADHAKPQRPGYVENAQIISVPADGKNGNCFGIGQRSCRDYIGGSAPSSSTTSKTSSTSKAPVTSSTTKAPSTTTSSATGGPATTTIVSGGDEYVCIKQSKLNAAKKRIPDWDDI